MDHCRPGGVVPDQPMLRLAPALAVEVLSPGNTREEMDRKLQDYFAAGVRLVWNVDPEARAVTVYTAPDRSCVLAEDQTLDGGDVLPGFTLPLRKLFARLGPSAEGSAPEKASPRARPKRRNSKRR